MSTKSPSFNAHTVEATVGTSETTIAHTLGRAPLDGFIIKRNGSGNVFRGATAWTASNIYLTASAGVTVTLLLF
jgi:hypothetical protein